MLEALAVNLKTQRTITEALNFKSFDSQDVGLMAHTSLLVFRMTEQNLNAIILRIERFHVLQ